jgi:hypothetical protein
MDGKRFDALTRDLTRGTSRRRIVASMIAMVAGGATLVDAGATQQRRTCRPIAASCLRHRDCCSGICNTLRSTPRNRRNRCACADGLVSCQGACTDLQGDAGNCGGCGSICPSGEICQSGACICVPNCDGKTCGDDGCGGSCGTCDPFHNCTDGACIEMCTDFASNGSSDECIVSVDNEEIYACGFNWDTGNFGQQACTTNEECRTRASDPNVYCAAFGGEPGSGTWTSDPNICWRPRFC